MKMGKQKCKTVQNKVQPTKHKGNDSEREKK